MVREKTRATFAVTGSRLAEKLNWWRHGTCHCGHHEAESLHEPLEKARINFRLINHTVTRTIGDCHKAFSDQVSPRTTAVIRTMARDWAGWKSLGFG